MSYCEGCADRDGHVDALKAHIQELEAALRILLAAWDDAEAQDECERHIERFRALAGEEAKGG